MATLTVCDHDGNPATLRVRVESFLGSTVAEFDCCSAQCAAECLSARLAPVVEPGDEPAVEEPVVEEPVVEETPAEGTVPNPED